MLTDLLIGLAIIVIMILFGEVVWKGGYEKGFAEGVEKGSKRIEIKDGTNIEIQRFHEKSHRFFLNIHEKEK